MSTAINYGYRVDHIEIDAANSCVRREGIDHILRYQTFHVLIYLLEHAGRPVPKEELIGAIWHEAAVTDNALTQCIAEIRKAFGDDPRNPTYIRTVSKVGYQFLASVEVVHNHESAAPVFLVQDAHDDVHGSNPSPLEPPALTVVAPAHAAPRPEADGAGSGKRRLSGRDHLRLGLLLVLLFFCGWAIPKLYVRMTGRIAGVAPLSGGRSLAVMYFANESGNRSDNWLRQGLTDMMITDMSQSGKLHVLGREELAALMKDEVRRKNGTADPAMQIAKAVHATDYLTGSFASVPGQFRIDIQLHNTRSGQIIYADHNVMANSDNILSQVDVLAAKLAAAMSLKPATRMSVAAATTSNLEAYQYYSLGVEKAEAFENAQALVLLKQAVALDPNFAMAWARIGYTYALADFAPAKGRPYLEKALALSAHLSEKDRLYVNAWLDISKGNYNAALQTLDRIIKLYPRDIEAYWRVARLLRAEERPLDAVRVLKQGLQFAPDDPNLNNTLGFVLLSLRRYPEAIAVEQHYVQLASDEPNSYDSLGMAYQHAGNYPAAFREYQTALAINPKFEPSIIHMGDAYYQTQQYSKALGEYQRYTKLASTSNARAFGYGDQSAVYLTLHRLNDARRAAALEMKNNPNAVWNSILIALDTGDHTRARQLEQLLFRDIPNQERGTPGDQRTRYYYMGTIALADGQAQQALTDFRTALTHLPPTSGMSDYEDCLANAELKLGEYPQAIAEYNRILKLNPHYPLARQHLAEAEAHVNTGKPNAS